MRGVGTGKIKYEFFPQPIIDLQRELQHPAHRELEKYNNPDLVEVIKSLCTELGIVLDGMYDGNDLMNLCEIMIKKLQERRGSLIVVSKGLK